MKNSPGCDENHPWELGILASDAVNGEDFKLEKVTLNPIWMENTEHFQGKKTTTNCTHRTLVSIYVELLYMQLCDY